MASWAERFKQASPAPAPGTALYVGAGSLGVVAEAAAAAEEGPAAAAADSPQPQAPKAAVELTDVVLDSGAIISSEMAKLAKPTIRYHTVREALAEIKDVQSRSALQAFPVKIHVAEVFEDSINFVRKFAALTGDLRQLSETDILILALGYQLEHQRCGMKNIREQPLTDHQAELKTLLARQQAQQAELQLQQQQEQQQEEQVQEQEQQQGPQDTPAPAGSEEAKEAKEAGQAEAGDADNDDLWITPDNVDEVDPAAAFKQGAHEEVDTVAFRKTSPVAVATVDFTMQNVMLQMGLRLLSVRGKEITGIRRWVQKCFCCGHTEPNMEREFCDWCGHHTLARAVVEVEPDGRVTIRENHRFIYNLRGTKYPIPKPKGGRHAKDLKFAEDVIDPRRRFAHKRNRKDDETLFQLGADFGYTSSKGPEGDTFGYGRRNPNRRTKNTGNKKRGNR